MWLIKMMLLLFRYILRNDTKKFVSLWSMNRHTENAIDLSTLMIVDRSTMTLLRKRFPAIFEQVRRQVFRHVTSTFFDAEAAEIPCHLAAFLVNNICEAAPEEGLVGCFLFFFIDLCFVFF